MPLSSYYRDVVLDTILPGGCYASLHTADPGLTGTNEVMGGSYGRKAIPYASASGGSKANSSDIAWANMPAANIAYVGIWDAASSGHFLWALPLTASKTTASGDTFTIATGNLVNTAV